MLYMPKLKTILQSKLLIILVIIWCLVNLFVVRHQSKYKENTTTISGTVLDYNFNGNLLKLTVKAQEKIKANYYLKNEEEKEQLEKTLGYNSTVVLKGTLSKPLENDIPNVFSYQKYLEHHQIYYVFNVSSLSIKPSSNILYQIKNWCYKRITNIKDSEYLKAFILGDNTDIANDLFRTNGVSHLFAISGMHLSLLVLILSKISFFKKNWPIILFLWFYAFLVGFTPSILRSVLFFTFKILIKKNISNLKLLIIVMEIMLLKNPFYIYDIGFIYSFLISFGLLTYQFVKTTKFQNLLKISIFIFFLSLPITAINFYKINFLTIILNIILIPLVSSIIYPLALLTFIFPIFNNVFNGFITLLIFINKLGEMFKFGILVIPKVTIFIWLIYYYFRQKQFYFLKNFIYGVAYTSLLFYFYFF